MKISDRSTMYMYYELRKKDSSDPQLQFAKLQKSYLLVIKYPHLYEPCHERNSILHMQNKGTEQLGSNCKS